ISMPIETFLRTKRTVPQEPEPSPKKSPKNEKNRPQKTKKQKKNSIIYVCLFYCCICSILTNAFHPVFTVFHCFITFRYGNYCSVFGFQAESEFSCLIFVDFKLRILFNFVIFNCLVFNIGNRCIIYNTVY